MKAVILAGGFGTRISEESSVRPKPMVEIGGRPVLWHILKIYSAHGINDFVICLGYKGYLIKEYFANYFLHMSDVTFDMANNRMQVHQQFAEPWQVTLVDTGEETQTGGRLKRVQRYVGGEDFCFTYGDGVSDVNVRDLVSYHRSRRHDRDTDGRPTARSIRRPGPGRRPDHLIRREAARRRLADQWGLLRVVAQGVRLYRGGRHGLGARSVGTPCA